jgi:hypothetical protein
MRRNFILLLMLAISVLLAGVAVASSHGSQSRGRPHPRQTEPTPEQKADFHKNREEFQKTKRKAGDEVVLVGLWRNCRFHILRLPGERYTAALPDGQVVESIEVARGVKAADEAEKQLPARDPACDNVEPTREQIDANRAEMEAEEARLNPGRPVRPGG